MVEREKVKYGLRCMCYGDVECKECHYARNGSGWHDCRSNCAKDALDLLKEQETRKGHWIEDETETYTENHDTWECSECHEPFTLTEGTPEENKFYFCPRCGAKMEFEGR